MAECARSPERFEWTWSASFVLCRTTLALSRISVQLERVGAAEARKPGDVRRVLERAVSLLPPTSADVKEAPAFTILRDGSDKRKPLRHQ